MMLRAKQEGVSERDVVSKDQLLRGSFTQNALFIRDSVKMFCSSGGSVKQKDRKGSFIGRIFKTPTRVCALEVNIC